MKKEKLSLGEALRLLGLDPKELHWLHYQPRVNPDYRIVEYTGYVAGEFSEYDVLRKAMSSLVERVGHKPSDSQFENGFVPLYTIGRIKITTDYATVHQGQRPANGVRQRVSIPVKIQWVWPDVEIFQ